MIKEVAYPGVIAPQVGHVELTLRTGATQIVYQDDDSAAYEMLAGLPVGTRVLLTYRVLDDKPIPEPVPLEPEYFEAVMECTPGTGWVEWGGRYFTTMLLGSPFIELFDGHSRARVRFYRRKPPKPRLKLRFGGKSTLDIFTPGRDWGYFACLAGLNEIPLKRYLFDAKKAWITVHPITEEEADEN